VIHKSRDRVITSLLYQDILVKWWTNDKWHSCDFCIVHCWSRNWCKAV